MRAETPDLGSGEERNCVLCGNALATLSQTDVTKMARNRPDGGNNQQMEGAWFCLGCSRLNRRDSPFVSSNHQITFEIQPGFVLGQMKRCFWRWRWVPRWVEIQVGHGGHVASKVVTDVELCKGHLKRQSLLEQMKQNQTIVETEEQCQ